MSSSSSSYQQILSRDDDVQFVTESEIMEVRSTHDLPIASKTRVKPLRQNNKDVDNIFVYVGIVLLVVAFIVLIIVDPSSQQQQQPTQLIHSTPNVRHHPSLMFCDANPIVKLLDKQRVQDLEQNEWTEWDANVLRRIMNYSKVIGNGLDDYLINFPPPYSPEDRCGGGIPGIVESFESLYPVHHLLPCPEPVELVGESKTAGDTAKWICMPDTLLSSSTVTSTLSPPSATEDNILFDDEMLVDDGSDKCVVVSIGSNNQFEFEESISQQYPDCEIYTFDCTSEPSPMPAPRSHFDKTCISDTNQQINGREYRTLDYLMQRHQIDSIRLAKWDVEGYEYHVFSGLLADPMNKKLPYQISTELHFHHAYTMGLLHMALIQQLHYSGYRLVSYQNNELCKSCNEVTFIRVYC